MNKIIMALLIIVVAFAIGTVLVKNKTHTETNQSSTENSLNSINMSDLQKKIKDKQDVLVYFYSPECEHCKKTTPILKKINNSLNLNLKAFNILNDKESWDKYKIQGTPTIIYFRNGKEEKRLIGERGEKEYTQWFESLNLKD